MGGISIWQLLIIAVIVVLLFGTNKLRTLGSDLGASVKGFKKAMGDENQKDTNNAEKTTNDADFDTKNLAQKTSTEEKSTTESKNKEQV